jgi:hypothetical protein
MITRKLGSLHGKLKVFQYEGTELINLSAVSERVLLHQTSEMSISLKQHWQSKIKSVI